MNSTCFANPWIRVQEPQIIECIEEIYRDKGYIVKNFHRDDTRHEEGVDLLCTSKNEQIAFAVKKKPGKKDITQLKKFMETTIEKKSIYVYIHSPSRPFQDAIEKYGSAVEIWNSKTLHKELLGNESISYMCLFFSGHKIAQSLTQVFKILYDKKGTRYSSHKLNQHEASILWLTKDNAVKMRTALYIIFRRWNKKLMNATKKQPLDYDKILDKIFSDLDIAFDFAGESLVASFERLAEEHPSLLGMYWTLASHRTGWSDLIFNLQRIDHKHVENFIHFNEVVPNPKANHYSGVMKGFYSSANYILEKMHEAAQDIEDGIDWVFSKKN